MKLWQTFGIAALSVGVALGSVQAAEVPEQAPSRMQVPVCTIDRQNTYMDMRIAAPAAEITYGLWGDVATRLQETVAHFRLQQVMDDDDLLKAALDNLALKLDQEYGIKLSGGPDGTPAHLCQEPLPVNLPPLDVGRIDVCIADESLTVSVIYGIVSNKEGYRTALAEGIRRAVTSYSGGMENSDGLDAAVTAEILAAEKQYGAETFFRFGETLQKGCKPQEMRM